MWVQDHQVQEANGVRDRATAINTGDMGTEVLPSERGKDTAEDKGIGWLYEIFFIPPMLLW